MCDCLSCNGIGWKSKADRIFTDIRSPYVIFPFKILISIIPFIYRYIRYCYRKSKNNQLPCIYTLRPLSLFAEHGVPCGSLGSGSIGRGFRGIFCKYALRPGLVEYGTVVSENQFIVSLRKQTERSNCCYQQVLSAYKAPTDKLQSWNFSIPTGCLHYRGLYPRSWSTYDLSWHHSCPVKLTCRQISPVLPNNYKDSCLPVCVFIWEIENLCANDAVECSIVLTIRNGVGNATLNGNRTCSANLFSAEDSDIRGVSLKHEFGGTGCVYSIGARANDANHDSASLSFRTYWDPNGTGSDLWSDLMSDGHLSDDSQSSDSNLELMQDLGIALCVNCKLAAGQSKSFEICLVWDMPVIQFGTRQRAYRRRYTRWFGDAGDAGSALCEYALKNYKKWEQAIDAWQKPILLDTRLPEWYKSALFNELYYLSDGGSVWLEYDESWRQTEPHLSDYSVALMKEYGRFLYLESYEYRMFNTYDVHFYASFALAQLWPRLEQVMQAEFCDQFGNKDDKLVQHLFDGDWAPVKTANRLPHDLGSPSKEPLIWTNAYHFHNTAQWRDLNLKFVLSSYRDWLMLGGGAEGYGLLTHCWPAVQSIIDIGLREWDRDSDGMIENSGTADQTYDAWPMSGVSAYCGGLWLSALRCSQRIAELLGHLEQRDAYARLFEKALRVYNEKLWTGEYYKFDEHSATHDSIMADQLCGYWLLKACDLADDSLLVDRVRRALSTLFANNVQRFCAGYSGAVNGMRPSGGGVELRAIQANEVWTGVTYALGALMISEGLVEEGFQTASGVYLSCFGEMGMQYQTPEAFYERYWYRAPGYMRALSIWAIQWALERQHNLSTHSKPLKSLISGRKN